jgi:hypothetical protein
VIGFQQRNGEYLHRKKASEKRVLRKISGPKREEVRGEWRRLHKNSTVCVSHQILFG